MIGLKDICFLDVETTGLDPDSGDRIIEISCLKFNKDKSLLVCFGNPEVNLSIFTSRVNPQGKKSSKEAFMLHKISDSELKNEKNFEDIADELVKFIDRKIVMAHNSSFDEKFFNSEMKKIGKEVKLKWVDSIEIFKSYFPEFKSYKLEYLAKNLQGIDIVGLHSAEEDVKALCMVYMGLYMNKSWRYVLTPFGSLSTEYLISFLAFVSLIIYFL